MSPSPRPTVRDNRQRSRFEDPPGARLCVRRDHEHLRDANSAVPRRGDCAWKQSAAVAAAKRGGPLGAYR
jgi:hypothetical protein